MYAFVQVLKPSAMGRKVPVCSTHPIQNLSWASRPPLPLKWLSVLPRCKAAHITINYLIFHTTRLSSKAFLRTSHPYTLDTRNEHVSSALLGQLYRRNRFYMSQVLGLNIKINKQKCHMKSPVSIVTSSCKQHRKFLWHTCFPHITHYRKYTSYIFIFNGWNF